MATHSGPSALSTIISRTRERLPELRRRKSEIEAAARSAPPPPPWGSVFGHADVSVIAEVKRRSPSAGAIAPGLDPAGHATSYIAGGARAVSVLTEESHFGGSLDDLRAVRGAVMAPVLRKDFILDPIQIVEARAAGASAVLLIGRILEASALADLAAVAREWGVATLVEVHDRTELDRALAAHPDCIGVNSRDLETFTVDLEGSALVFRELPPGVPSVAESGVRVREDVVRMSGWGADAVLVGTTVAAASDPCEAVRQLTGVPRRRLAGPAGDRPL